MSYQKQNFANGEVLAAPQLNHIEDGIVEVESSVEDKATKEELKNIIDPTLSVEGKAADAKATGAAVDKLEDKKADKTNLTAEVARATGEEQRLDTAITAETTRAEQAEQALSARTDALESCGFVVVNGKVCMKYVKS